MVHHKKRPVSGRTHNNSNGNDNSDDQSPSDPQERPATAHGNRNHANPHANKRSRTNSAHAAASASAHAHHAHDVSSYSNDKPYRFITSAARARTTAAEPAAAHPGSLLEGISKPTRSGHPIIPGNVCKEFDTISSSNISGGDGGGGAAARPRGDPRGGGGGGGSRNSGRPEREHQQQQKRGRQQRNNAQNNPLGFALQQQTGNVPKIKSQSVMTQNSWTRNSLTASIGTSNTSSNTNSNDRRAQQNRHDDMAQKPQQQNAARLMLSKAKRHNSNDNSNDNNANNTSMHSLNESIPRRRSGSSISPVAGAPHKLNSKTTTESKDGDVSKYFATVETKSNSKSKSKSKHKKSSNTSDFVDLCDDEIVHVDNDSRKPAAKSSRDSDQSNQQPTTRYGSIQIDETSSHSEDETQPQTQRPQHTESPVSGSKEMAVFQSIANDESRGSWSNSNEDAAVAAAPDSPMASPEDHPGKAAQKSPLGIVYGAVSSTARGLGGFVANKLWKPKTSSVLNLSKTKNTEFGASLLSSSSTSTVKRKKFGKSKGKSIDASASFNSWKEEYKDDLETIPITRSTSRRQSGIEATSFHGKSETTRQTTMTGQSCPSIRRKSDRTNKKGKTKHTPETITIDDDSESEVEQSPPPKVGTRRTEYDAVRIAFGTKVFFSDCKFALNNMGMLELSFKQTQRDMTRNRRGASQKEKGSEDYQTIQFNLANDLREVKYYIAGDTSDNEEASVRSSDDSTESMSFLAMKVDISKSSNFRYPNHYKPNGRDLSKGFILVEFRSDTEFTELLEIVEGLSSLRPYFDKQAQLTTKTAESYCKPFIKDSNNERIMSRNSIESPTSRNKQGFLAGKKEEDILLVYPFEGDEELIEKAAKGLSEASRGGPYNADSSSEKVVVEAMEIDTTDLEVSDEGKASSGGSDKDEAEPETKTRGRAHFLTVRVEDYERLEPGEFLNDTLIDFWMQWISRHDDGSLVHFFSSHFYSALVKDRPSGVKRWTEKKGIDIFQKKFIFIPINKTLHWSQCIVVNPGAIIKHNNELNKWDKVGFVGEGEGFDFDAPFPCIIFLDSLKAHQKAQVAKNVRAWLNAEWKRLGKSDDPALAPFTDSMTVFTPKIPYQDNSWDCGVFVCRYAYAVYLLRHRSFSYREANAFAEGPKLRFQELITDSPEFSFSMPDIARIRNEMKTLIERLSGVYLPWKQEENRKEKEEKAAEKEAKAATRKATILSGVAKAGQNMSENESNEKETSTDIQAANESATSATAVLSAAKADEDDNVKVAANASIEDMDISTQSEDESSPQEKMIV